MSVILGINMPLSVAVTSNIAEGSGSKLFTLMAAPMELWLPVAPDAPVVVAHGAFHPLPL
jgi:hypothetical protein